MIQTVSGTEGFSAIFALVRQGSWKMYVFNMLPQVAPVSSLFPTDSALVHFWSTCWILDNVLIEHGHTNVACNHMDHEIWYLYTSLIKILKDLTNKLFVKLYLLTF